MAASPYYGDWVSADGLSEAEVRVLPPDGPWPAMVSIEASFGGSLMAEDAKALEAHIGAAASNADWLSRRHFALTKQSAPKPVVEP